MTDQSKALERTVDPKQSLAVILQDHAAEFRRVAPKYVNVERLTQLALQAKLRNPLLANCSPESVLNFCMKCSETGTDRIGAGGMWPVPFWSNKTKTYEMVPIPDWRLLIEKAKKANAILHATADDVRERDFLNIERGMHSDLRHTPALKDRGELVGVYCVYTLPDGTKDFVYMDWETEVKPIRDRTNAWKSWLKDKKENPWVTHPAEQAKKTVVKRAMKLFEGASIELTKLIEVDNVINGYPTIEVEARPAIMEPRELPQATDQPTEPEPKATEPDELQPLEEIMGDEPQSEPTPDQSPKKSTKNVTGIVENVSKKMVNDGTLYGIKVGGVYYNTFNDELGESAEACKEAKQQITLAYEITSKGYKNAVEISIARDSG